MSAPASSISDWLIIGNGRRKHAVPHGSHYAFCGIGGDVSEPKTATPECKVCRALIDKMHAEYFRKKEAAK
jgi:hypothetical protein